MVKSEYIVYICKEYLPFPLASASAMPLLTLGVGFFKPDSMILALSCVFLH